MLKPFKYLTQEFQSKKPHSDQRSAIETRVYGNILMFSNNKQPKPTTFIMGRKRQYNTFLLKKHPRKDNNPTSRFYAGAKG